MSSQRKEASCEASSSKSSCCSNGTDKPNEKTTTNVATTKKDDEDEEDQWEDLFDEDDESMINKLSELTLANKKKTNPSVKKTDEKSPPKGTKTSTSTATTATTTAAQAAVAAAASARPQTQALSAKIIDYLKFEPKAAAASPSNQTNQQQQANNTNESDDKDEFLRAEYAHMIEIYDFPACFKNENIINALTHGTGIDNFSIKWVDDTHCLGVFSSAAEAQKALKVDNQSVRTRAIHESSEQTRQMAKRKLEQLKPFKARPQTSNLVANRLIGASLGIRLPKEKQDIERNKLKMAKEKSQKDKDLKDSIWNGETA